MTDFDNDDIQNSSFPVEFNDTEALDMYGVWVKSGPRDASLSLHAAQPVVSKPDTIEADNFDDISSFGELPDLDDFSTDSLESPESTIDSFDDLVEETIPEEPTISFDEESVNVETFTDIEDLSEESLPSDWVESATLDDAILDIAGVVDEEPLEQELAVEDSFVIEDISDSEDLLQSSSTVEESFSLDDLHLETSDSITSEIELPLPEDTITEFEEEMPNIEVETVEEKASDDDLSDFLPQDVDLSAFLSDFDTSTPPNNDKKEAISSTSDDFDLDSFVNEFNETGGAQESDKEKLFEDVEPVEIDLDFDEDFIEEAEKIRATGASVTESEFFNSEFGVELIDETGNTNVQESASDDFSFFDAESPESPVKKAESRQSKDIAGTEDASEFDDLLASLDTAQVNPVARETVKKPVSTTSYDLVVTEEEGLESVSTTDTTANTDDDFTVSLFESASADSAFISPSSEQVPEQMDTIHTQEAVSDLSDLANFADVSALSTEDESVVLDDSVSFDQEEIPFQEEISVIDEVVLEEKLDIPPVSDYNEPIFEPESAQSDVPDVEEGVSLDFDDISAVEKELNETVPKTGEEQVISNDKSTELLMIIADELSSIKKEISTLKNELAGYKGSAPSSDSQAVSAADAENSGFFSDDDTDETIALTGDELNNILITADFTEEKTEEVQGQSVEEETIDLTSEFVEQSIVEDDEEYIDESASITGTQTDEVEIPDTLPESIFDSATIQAEQVPVSHINKIEDDLGYLDGSDMIEPDLDNVAIDEPELEIIDFNDEKLEEPELAEFNIDLSDIESDFPAEQELPAEDADQIIESAEFDVSVDEEIAAKEDLTVDLEESMPEQETEVPEEDITPTKTSDQVASLPVELKDEIKSVLSYMDQLLESLPEDKIEEFARSEHFEVYKKLFEELGIS